MFQDHQKIIIHGKHINLIQRTLDYDFLIGREPSIVAIVSSAAGDMKLFFGDKEIIIPVVPDFQALTTNYHVSQMIGNDQAILVNLASFRSAYQVTVDAIGSKLFSTIIVIAEGIAERQSKELIALAHMYGVNVVGPSTVGLIVPGMLRVGHTGGDLVNVCESRLYRAGSLGLVSKSGGMMNELCRVISKNSDGVAIAISIGGDRFPYMTFVDVVCSYQDNPSVKMIVLFGEVGNQDENEIAQLVRDGIITKPIVAWISGQSAELLTSEIQFGHAGAKANSDHEKASYKMQQLRDAGCAVAHSYEDFGSLIRHEYEVKFGPVIEDIVPQIIIDKVQLLKYRKNTLVTSTISNETGEELTYNKIPVSDFVSSGSIARVLGHLWLAKELPAYALEFLNTCIILLADHGPGVSGAVNTIVTTRAGKDMVSSLVAGLLTVGPRFGGAIDGCALMLIQAARDHFTALDVVNQYKQSGTPIPGIGHKLKSKYNPDHRCQILAELSLNFPVRTNLLFAQAIEELTLEKKANLILNVDGHIAAMFLDILTDLGYSLEEQQGLVQTGLLNGIFVLARTIGLIGHHIDQKNIGDGLFRLGKDEILYL